MRNNPFIPPLPSKDHFNNARTSARIRHFAAQDRGLVVRRGVGELETLIVFVLMGVIIIAYCCAVFIGTIAYLDGDIDISHAIAGRAADFDALTSLWKFRMGERGSGRRNARGAKRL